jgi:hypothetical protein
MNAHHRLWPISCSHTIDRRLHSAIHVSKTNVFKEPLRSQTCLVCLIHLQIVRFRYIRVAGAIYPAVITNPHIYTGLAVVNSLILTRDDLTLVQRGFYVLCCCLISQFVPYRECLDVVALFNHISQTISFCPMLTWLIFLRHCLNQCNIVKNGAHIFHDS